MVQTSSNPSRQSERFTGPRRQRYKSLSEARKDAELPAGEFEVVHPASRQVRPLADRENVRQDR